MKEITGDCPLGAKCEEVQIRAGENVLVRCPWFIKVKGIDPNSGMEIDNWNCAIAWMPMLSINIADQTRRTTQATEQMRNKVKI